MKTLRLSLTLMTLALPLTACVTEDDRPASETVVRQPSTNDSELPPEAIDGLPSEHVNNPVTKEKGGEPALTPDDIEADADPMKIVFETAKWNLSDVAIGRIQNVADQMKADDELTLKIDGHCDERGTDGYNQVLSEKRAHAVYLELKKMGISGKRLSEQGYGRKKAAIQGHSEKVYSHNRRVEMIFNKKS